ncbi:crossover junction endodeoxyribonuclease RuvC [Zavarzinia sp. CC-PAN008]|uniref:crossover junction endodeoxyribonuclease RuvC n=1 Tax=Zavarzinia sp. CC-PAN008 TaxID=3243332 RepID=UPI003F747DBD
MRLIGLDPGLRRTGWGVIDMTGSRLAHVAHGTVTSDDAADLAVRLRQIHDGVVAVIAEQRPDQAAVEETFVNRNPASTLKLGQVRGVVMLAPALAGLPVAEYAPTRVKQAVVGTGRADKDQIRAMLKVLLPAVEIAGADAADALAIAICHAHHSGPQARVAVALAATRPAAGKAAPRVRVAVR